MECFIPATYMRYVNPELEDDADSTWLWQKRYVSRSSTFWPKMKKWMKKHMATKHIYEETGDNFTV
jgi:hypothetical protein